MGSLNIESKSGGRGARQVHLNGGAASGKCVVGVGGTCSQGKRVHLYGGAAAMSEGVMPLQWEGK